MAGDDERRREHREPLTLKVEYIDAEGLVHDYTKNISQGGTFVVTDRLLPLGTEVKLVLSFPGLIKPVPLAARVKWHRESTDESERGVGVEFDLGDWGSRDRFEKMVQRIADGDPELVARTMRVLVVEDNPHVAALIRDGLQGGVKRALSGRVAFDFVMAKDGREARDVLMAGGAHFDLLIIDVYLPILDGISVIKQVRANPEMATMPIVSVSAGGPAARQAALSAGADFFLDKPMRLLDIVDTIRKLTGMT